MQYDPYELHNKLQTVMKRMYPGFSSIAAILTGEPGTGKSTVIASAPLPPNTKRLIFDMEGSMDYLDAGPEGMDIYTPNRQTFSMVRVKFPSIEAIAKGYRAVAHPEEDKNQKYRYGSLGIDNIAKFQEALLQWLINNAKDAGLVRAMWTKFDLLKVLPVDSAIQKWANFQDGGIWYPLRSIATAIVLACKANGVYFLSTSETRNVWVNYNQPGAAIIGTTAKIWKTWYQNTDFVLSLTRDVNSRNAPMGELSKFQPKMRLQNLNPKFKMDWEGFIHELELAETRTEKEIPEEYRVKDMNITEDDGNPAENIPTENKPEEF
jgi:hypothetical protein